MLNNNYPLAFVENNYVFYFQISPKNYSLATFIQNERLLRLLCPEWFVSVKCFFTNNSTTWGGQCSNPEIHTPAEQFLLGKEDFKKK